MPTGKKCLSHVQLVIKNTPLERARKTESVDVILKKNS